VVEIIGHLHTPTNTDPGKYPVRIVFSEDDLNAAADGGRLITQVVYLEDPEQATPVHLAKDEVPSVELTAAENPLRVAGALGRPMAVIHLGGRVPTPEELAGPPIVPIRGGPCPYIGSSGDPCAAECGVSFIPAPKPGKLPKDEYLCDGGDHNSPARFGAQGTLEGIEPRDAVLEFRKPSTDQVEPEVEKLRAKLRAGEISRYTFDIQVRRLYQSTVGDTRPRVLPTNMVCVYAPRFAAVRTSLGPNEARTVDIPISAERLDRQASIGSRQAIKKFVLQQGPELARVRARASSLIEDIAAGGFTEVRVLGVNDAITHPAGHVLVQTPEFSRNTARTVERQLNARPEGIKTPEAPVVTGISQGSGQAVMSWKPQELASVEEPPSRPGIEVLKQASIVEAEPGDVVTFTIGYRNMGNMAIGSVSVVDSLLPRLDYVPGSSTGPQGTVFTVRANTSGSTELRWDLPGTLPAGAKGSVSFQARVR
jgi:uncharacterized repeat protein (TIGR01451 family)